MAEDERYLGEVETACAGAQTQATNCTLWPTNHWNTSSYVYNLTNYFHFENISLHPFQDQNNEIISKMKTNSSLKAHARRKEQAENHILFQLTQLKSAVAMVEQIGIRSRQKVRQDGEVMRISSAVSLHPYGYLSSLRRHQNRG